MTLVLPVHVQCRTGCVGVVSILVLLLLGGLGREAGAQAVDDTSRPSDVEPAELDSLPTSGNLSLPLRPADGRSSPSDTGDVERTYVEADSLSTLRRGGERVQEMFGNVFIRHDTTHLRSAYALRYLNRDEVLFVDDVVIYERGDTLRADTVRYDRDAEVGHARGRVQLTNGDVVVRADRATYYDSEKRSVFPDSVVLVDSNRVLRARHGTYWSDEERAEFGGGVRLTEPGTTVLSDSLTYYRDQDRSVARGHVFVDRRGEEEAQADTTSRTYLFGDWVDNREARRYSRVDGDALLVRVRTDSTGAPTDTLVVKARRLEAFRTDAHRRLVAVGAVRIWQSDLSAVADSAVYDRVVAPTADSAGSGPVPIDTAQSASDTTTVVATRTPPSPDASPLPSSRDSPAGRAREQPDGEEGTSPSASDTTRGRRPPEGEPLPDSTARRRSASVPGWASRAWNTPTAQSDSVLPLEETRLFRSPVTWFERSQVWGDSIRVRARNRQPDTVFVRGSAFAAQRDSVLDRIQQLKALNLVAFFRAGSLRRLRAEPNAEAIRFLAAENDSLNGAARTSGDRIVLRFRDGGVYRISVIGGTQTTYYRQSENIPDPFELEGFQWTPDRRPTRKELLRDPRVRQRLDLDVGPAPRRVAGPVPSDTTARPRPRRSSATAPASEQQRTASFPRPVPDSLRRDGSVPPDTGDASGRPLPRDTSETRYNPNP